MIRITFLGTSAGIPSFSRNHPSIAIEYFGKDYKLFLLDCGEGTQLQLMKAGISFMKINSIFITHWHADHFAGLISLIQTMNIEGREKSLRIFAPEASKYVKNILNLYAYKPFFEILPIDVELSENPKKFFEDEELEFSAIKVKHSVNSVAYSVKEKDKYTIDEEKLKSFNLKKGKWLDVIKKKGYYEFEDGKKIKIEEIAVLKKGLKITYSGDCIYDENLVKLAKDSKILIHEATYAESDKDEEKLHSSVSDAAKIASLAGVELLVLTHISRRYQTEDDIINILTEAKKIFRNVIVAEDFLVIEVCKDKTNIYKKV
ncbi:MAG: ribonuclease Z [Candidatus Aenigmatarchaeota archaeon]